VSDSPSSAAPRRRRLRSAGTAAAVASLTALTSACAAAGGAVAGPAPAPATSTLPPVPPATAPSLSQEQVDHAVSSLDGLVTDAMDRTGVPGVAVAVVYRDQVVYSKGFGVREVGRPELVDPDTVFQLASVSKPLASTVIAGVVGQGVVEWDQPVGEYDPSFALNDPYVTEHATLADLLSHRSGLHTGAGDLLEDLGFDREYVLSHLDQQPLDPFRSSYNYSNFGYTAGAEAAAVATGTSWEDLADQVLFDPLGMTDTSYRHEDYVAAADKAVIHVPAGDGTWVARYTRDADAEAPAGGASSSVRDLAQWIRLQLGNGVHDGTQVIDPDALAVTRVPRTRSPVRRRPRTPAPASTAWAGTSPTTTRDGCRSGTPVPSPSAPPPRCSCSPASSSASWP
jgi:CubicO group peptidase (beta-lactamase class C family)